MTTAAQKPLKVFCSYSDKDEEHLNDLRDSLRGLERQVLIEWWHDREIAPGWEWEEAIDKHLRTADIILLLVSPDFMSSAYVFDKEIDVAIERHERGEARVIPIIVRPVHWEVASFGKLQALPKDAKPITRWPDRDEAWLNVTDGIQKAVEELLDKRRERATAEERYREVLEETRAANIEREVMGDTKEAILERQEQTPTETEAVGPHEQQVRTEQLAPKEPDVLSPETIFISYSRRDWDEFVQPLVTDLRQRGFKVWIDQSIRGGSRWGDAIQEALDTCERMVLCVSPNSIQSPQAKAEYRYFLGMNKTVIPLVLRESRTPYNLASIQFISYGDWDVLIQELRE